MGDYPPRADGRLLAAVGELDPAGAISPADAESIDIIGGKVQLGVEVSRSGRL